MSDLVISLNMGRPEQAEMLRHTAARFGYDLEFFGQGQTFTDFRQAKMGLVLDTLRSATTDYVAFTDSWDSWFIRKGLFDKFRRTGKDFIMSTNRDHYPDSKLYIVYPPSFTSFRFLCSSQFIGKREVLIEAFEKMIEGYDGYTDQEGWNWYYVTNQSPKLTPDYYCDLFLNFTNVEPQEFVDGVLKETLSTPCAIHFGGPKGDSPNGRMMQYFKDLYANQLS